MPYFSIIIPVYNRPDEVNDLLESLSKQTYKDFEVIIVEDGSTVCCAKDLNEKMINKQENARASINEKARQLKKEQDDFQRKYQNNAFLSPERAQQEYQRLEKKAADLQEYAQRLENENMLEQQKMLMQMNDSINLFIKEYNKEKKYEAIFNNASTLYINPQYDITNEVVELLNKRYTSAKK